MVGEDDETNETANHDQTVITVIDIAVSNQITDSIIVITSKTD